MRNILALLLVLAAMPTWAQESTPVPVWSDLIPGALLYTGQVVSSTLPFPESWLANGSLLVAADVPSLFTTSGDNLPSVGLGTALLASAGALALASLGVEADMVAGEVFTAGMKVNYWNIYVGATAAPEDPFELALAPWSPQVVSRPSVWGAVLATQLASTAYVLLRSGGQAAIWATGKSYWRGFEMPVWQGLAMALAVGTISNTVTAIGEEAFFRGVQYSGFKKTMNKNLAGFADNALFVAIHVPQELKVNLPAGEIAVHALVRALAGMMFQAAYDDAGLSGSVAAHMWSNVFAEVGSYLLGGGVPGASLELGFALEL